jgi:hypothetical protein
MGAAREAEILRRNADTLRKIARAAGKAGNVEECLKRGIESARIEAKAAKLIYDAKNVDPVMRAMRSAELKKARIARQLKKQHDKYVARRAARVNAENAVVRKEEEVSPESS